MKNFLDKYSALHGSYELISEDEDVQPHAMEEWVQGDVYYFKSNKAFVFITQLPFPIIDIAIDGFDPENLSDMDNAQILSSRLGHFGEHEKADLVDVWMTRHNLKGVYICPHCGREYDETDFDEKGWETLRNGLKCESDDCPFGE